MTTMTKYKWFWAWDDEKEENWLRAMALKGWHPDAAAPHHPAAEEIVEMGLTLLGHPGLFILPAISPTFQNQRACRVRDKSS